MPVSFRILPEHGIVYVRYEGFALLDETLQAFGEYAAHPLARPGQKHLIDLAEVTGIEQDYVKMMRVQAGKADALMGTGQQTLMVYYAPTRLSYEMSKFILRSWEGIEAVVPLVQQDETQALALLGVDRNSFAELLEDSR